MELDVREVDFLLQKLAHKTWVRCVLFSLVAVVAVALSLLLGPKIPEDVAVKLGADAIGSLLTILATSMLTVAVFSASTMVASFNVLATGATPRAAQRFVYALAQAIHAGMLASDVQRLREAARQLNRQENSHAQNR